MAVEFVCSVWRFIWFLIVFSDLKPSCQAPKTTVPFDSTQLSQTVLPEWDKLCPYTQFCERNASKTISLSKDQTLCCSSCSCKPDCGLTQSCCRYEMDTFRLNERYSTRCMSLSTSDDDKISSYQTVHTCPNITSCYAFVGAAPWGSINPVYSPITKNIYLNQLCAACHNDTYFIEWKIEVNCKIFQDKLVNLQPGLQNALNGDFKKCSFTFFPPTGYNLEKKLCSPYIVSKCNYISYGSEIKKEYSRLCESFNATFITKNIVYANVYCFYCSDLKSVNETKQYICQRDDMYRTRNVPFSFMLSTEARDYLTVYKKENTKITKNQDCEVDELKERKTGLCRKYYCPDGQYLVAGKCTYLTDEWTAGPFKAYIHLNPISNMTIPLSALEDLSTGNDKVFKSYMRQWQHTLYYSLKRDSRFVDYLVLELKHRAGKMNPTKLINQYKAALNYILIMNLNGSAYRFFTSANKYYWYEWSDITREKNFVLKGSVLSPFFNIYTEVDNRQQTNEKLYLLRDKKINLLENVISLRKLYLCLNVDLNPDEYIFTGTRLYFKITQQYLEQAEFKVTSHNGQDTVSVCMEDFGENYWMNRSSKITVISTLHTVVFVLFYVHYIYVL